jgi:hypothetical protein
MSFVVLSCPAFNAHPQDGVLAALFRSGGKCVSAKVD